jgi:hypothetical protein
VIDRLSVVESVVGELEEKAALQQQKITLLHRMNDRLSTVERSVERLQEKPVSHRWDSGELRSQIPRQTGDLNVEAEVVRPSRRGRSVASPAKPMANGGRFSPASGLLNGIIAHLTTECGGNVVDCGIVAVTASSDNGNKPRNVTDLQDPSSFFMSMDSPNQWICYDFTTIQVTPTHYSLQSYPFEPPGSAYPRSWCIEVSNEGTKWTAIHEHRDKKELQGKNYIATFPVSKSQPCRFVRLRSTGKDSLGRNFLTLSGFELFGALHGP